MNVLDSKAKHHQIFFYTSVYKTLYPIRKTINENRYTISMKIRPNKYSLRRELNIIEEQNKPVEKG
jgi:hypothetical protein